MVASLEVIGKLVSPQLERPHPLVERESIPYGERKSGAVPQLLLEQREQSLQAPRRAGRMMCYFLLVEW